MSGESAADRLRAARVAANLTQDEAAQLLGVTGKTVSRWETGAPVKPRDLAAAEQAYAEAAAGSGLDKKVPRGTVALDTAAHLPGPLAAIARRFELEMARLGGTDEEVDHVDATLHSEHVAILVNQRQDGSPRTAEERDAEFRLQMRALLRWLLMRMEFLNRTPGDLAAIEAIIGAPSTLPGGAKFEADHTRKAERPSTTKRKTAGE